MLRRAREHHAERLRDRNPEAWGVSAEIVQLATSKDSVNVRIGERKRIVHARRSDAFESLHRAKRYNDAGELIGGISDPQHRAAERYVKDWLARIGVRTGDAALMPVDAANDGQGLTQVMIDAAKRISAAHAAIGRTPARLLQALVEPLVWGEVRIWQMLVQQATGEKDAHAQAAVVRMALQLLVEHHDVVDGRAAAPDEAQARSAVRVWRAE